MTLACDWCYRITKELTGYIVLGPEAWPEPTNICWTEARAKVEDHPTDSAIPKATVPVKLNNKKPQKRKDQAILN